MGHEPQHGEQQGQAEHAANGGHLQHVGQVELPAHAVEAKALLDAELPVEREGQVDQAADHGHAGNQRHAVGVSRAKGVDPELVDPLQPAQHGQHDQQRGAGQHFQHRQPGAGDGVVGRLLVRGQRNGVGKAGRDRMTVLRHMAHLAGGQPELGQHHQHQGG